MDNRKKLLNQIFWLTAIFLLAVVEFFMHRETAFMMDDIWYGTNLATGEPLRSLGDIVEGQIWHFMNWGGRSMTHAALQLTLMSGELAADRLSIEQQAEEAGQASVKRQCKKWQKLFLVFEVILAIVGFGIPGLQTFAWFLITYLLFVQMFAIWENILEKNARLLRWSPLLFGFFWLRGIFRMLELMSIF